MLPWIALIVAIVDLGFIAILTLCLMSGLRVLAKEIEVNRIWMVAEDERREQGSQNLPPVPSFVREADAADRGGENGAGTNV